VSLWARGRSGWSPGFVCEDGRRSLLEPGRPRLGAAALGFGPIGSVSVADAVPIVAEEARSGAPEGRPEAGKRAPASVPWIG